MRIMIFDTETIGKVSQDLLNVGYKIIDLDIQHAKYKVLCERDYLVSDLINNAVYCLNDDFVGAGKYGAYMELLAQKKIVKHKLSKIFNIMEKDIKKYDVLFTYAYNCNFDVGKFECSASNYNLHNPLENIKTFDIWAYAKKYICNTNEYMEWAKENGQLTASQIYISTTVESVTRYLTNNLEFVEDHTALSDVQWETAILVECVKRGCDITRPMELGSNIKSGYVFTETIITQDGQSIDLEYTSKYTRNGKTTYKK